MSDKEQLEELAFQAAVQFTMAVHKGLRPGLDEAYGTMFSKLRRAGKYAHLSRLHQSGEMVMREDGIRFTFTAPIMRSLVVRCKKRDTTGTSVQFDIVSRGHLGPGTSIYHASRDILFEVNGDWPDTKRRGVRKIAHLLFPYIGIKYSERNKHIINAGCQALSKHIIE